MPALTFVIQYYAFPKFLVEHALTKFQLFTIATIGFKSIKG